MSVRLCQGSYLHGGAHGCRTLRAKHLLGCLHGGHRGVLRSHCDAVCMCATLTVPHQAQAHPAWALADTGSRPRTDRASTGYPAGLPLALLPRRGGREMRHPAAVLWSRGRRGTRHERTTSVGASRRIKRGRRRRRGVARWSMAGASSRPFSLVSDGSHVLPPLRLDAGQQDRARRRHAGSLIVTDHRLTSVHHPRPGGSPDARA